MKKILLRSILSVFTVSVLLIASSQSSIVKGGNVKTLNETVITHDNKEYEFNQFSETWHTYDFTETSIGNYSNDKNISTKSLRTNMIFEDGKLLCKEGEKYSFGSGVFMGDPYGLYDGKASFDLSVTGGSLSFGMRLSKAIAVPDESGLWFEFTESGITVSESTSGFNAKVSVDIPEDSHVDILDGGELVTVKVNGEIAFEVSLPHGALVVFDSEGKALGYKTDIEIQSNGYISLYADSHEGYVDNFSFNQISVTQYSPTTNKTIDYSNWVATDDLDRVVSDGDGNVREEKQVGIFYFLCLTGDDLEIIKDNTKVYQTYGIEGLQEYYTSLVNAGSYYWAEPYFGYYRNTDKWVYRKHALQLEAAGVDFIFIDVSNGVTYNDALMTLLDTWLSMRQSGLSTPDICFLCGNDANNIGFSLTSLKTSVYSEQNFEKYRELFYEYQGKPLIFANKSNLNEAYLSYLENFTVRHCWAWCDEDGAWSWLQEYVNNPDGTVTMQAGGWGRDKEGNNEALALCVGHHPTTSKGRSYANGIFPETSEMGFDLDSGSGIGMEAQFEAIKKLDPTFMLVTGWNEWIAWSCNEKDKIVNFAGTSVLGYYFVDQFSPEYSRDVEPMKSRDGLGFGDNYYYQLCKYIREFKGMKKADASTVQKTVDLTDFSQWDEIDPTFDDTVGDTAYRSEIGFFSHMTYVNNTGRNDFDVLKVSSDSNYLYFYAKCVNDIVTDDSRNWMNLFISVDGDSSNGWEGYDFVINRGRDGFYASVESLSDGWSGTDVGQALYNVCGNEMVIRVSKSILGMEGDNVELLFKWADNSTLDGNVMEFMDLGDTAPNDRFSYSFTGVSGETEEITYTLADKEGNSVETRDESSAFPWSEEEDYDVSEPSEDETSDSSEMNSSEAESSEEPSVSEESSVSEPSSEKDDSQNENGTSDTLMIILCLAVVLLSIVSAIILPKKIAKK